jgi:tetrahydromethanopterin S-methyltransferase subunit G
MKVRGEEDGLEERIEEAWADGGVDRVVLPAGDVQKRLLIQRTFLGASWLLMLPVFIWLMWPWIDESMGSGPEPGGAGVQAIGKRLEEVRGKLEQLRRKRDAEPKGGGKTADERRLESEEGKLRQRLGRSSGAAEDVEMRVAIGVIGLAIWSVMIALAVRSRLYRPTGG